jgi:hypothetical protein
MHTNISMKKVLSHAPILGLLLSTILSSAAMDSPNLNIELFKTPGPITLTVGETIPDNCQRRGEFIRLIEQTPLTGVKVAQDGKVKKEVGFTFPTTAPWCLLTTKYIRSLDFRPTMGDWGCGNGFFSRHALIAGANPFAMDSSLEAANEANALIYRAGVYLPEGLDVKTIYKAMKTSVVEPAKVFMNRKNHINVAFNVIHYLCPGDADQFLINLFVNTLQGGIVVLSSDTPFGQDNVNLDFYNEGVVLGNKYPGYGLYSTSTVVPLNQPNQRLSRNRCVHRLTVEEESTGKFQMGVMYKGIYPALNNYDDGSTITVLDPMSDKKDILGKQSGMPYAYATGHQLFNRLEYNGLKLVLEAAGFTVINGWYTDHNIDTLYPHDDMEAFERIRKSKVVIVAQKL